MLESGVTMLDTIVNNYLQCGQTTLFKPDILQALLAAYLCFLERNVSQNTRPLL